MAKEIAKLELKKIVRDKKIMVRFEKEVYEKVEELARNNNQSMGYVIAHIVRFYLDSQK